MSKMAVQTVMNLSASLNLSFIYKLDKLYVHYRSTQT